MIKVKDGYAKLFGTAYNGSSSRVLLSNGSDIGKDVNSTASTLVERNASGQIVSSLATGTAPFVVSSTTTVSNLTSNYSEVLKRIGGNINLDANTISSGLGMSFYGGYSYKNASNLPEVNQEAAWQTALINFGILDSINAQLFIGASNNNLYYRRNQEQTWKQIAYTSSNITGSAGKVANKFTLKINTGTTEGTSLYTYDGSSAKTLDIQSGTGIGFTNNTAGVLSIYNSGVRSIATGTTNGTISVNTNGEAADVAVKGLGSAAYTSSDIYQKHASYQSTSGNSEFKKVTITKNNADGYGIWIHARQQHYLITSGFVSGSTLMNVFYELNTSFNDVALNSNNRNIHIKMIAKASSSDVTLYIGIDAYSYFQVVSSGTITISNSTKSEYDSITSSTTGWISCQSAKWTDTTYGVVSNSANGLAPKVISTNTDTIGSAYYVLASTNGSTTPSWYKLPANAFANDDTKVSQGNTTANKDYRVLLSSTDTNTTLTDVSYKSSKLTFNPNTGFLNVSGGGKYAIFKHSEPTLETLYNSTNAFKLIRSSDNDYGLYIWLNGDTGGTHFDSCKGSDQSVRNLCLNTLGGKVGIGITQPTEKLEVYGNIKATSFIGNLDGSYVNKLTGYTKATTAANITYEDTLNTALGKLEYKAGTAYDWVISVTAEDTDKYVNKWQEILDFLSKVEDGNDLTDEFVTRKTDQTITGTKTFSTMPTFNAGIDLGANQHISWNTGSYRQRLWNTDDSTANTAVFTFQQSTDSGSTWSDLLTIKDNGNVLATKFITSGGTSSQFVKGDGSLDSTSYMKVGTSGKDTAYYRTHKINGSDWGFLSHTSSPGFTIYAPTTAGISGQLLVSSGGEPIWTNSESITVGNSNKLNNYTDKDFSYRFTVNAGKTYIGWIKILEWTLSKSNHFSERPFLLQFYRSYNSPSPESYLISCNSSWNTASLVLLNGAGREKIIEKFKLSCSEDGFTWWLEMYVNPTYTTYNNVCYITINTHYQFSGVPKNETQNESSVSITEVNTVTGTNLKQLYVSNFINSAKFVTEGGTSSQFVKGDGSLDSNTYATTTQLSNYLPLSGGTLTGPLTLQANRYSGNYALNLQNSNIIGVNSIIMRDVADDPGEGIQFVRSNSNYDSIWCKDGVFYFSPNGTYSSSTNYPNTYTVLHSSNYTTYTVKKDGTGATGNWNIDISGSASKLSVNAGSNKDPVYFANGVPVACTHLNIKRYYSINLTSLSKSNFYPVIFEPSHDMTDCEVRSPSYSGGEPYNQNTIHFTFYANGWSDCPRSLRIIHYKCYASSEITIGAIGYGNAGGGYQCIWLRGGFEYQFYSNKEPYLKSSDFTSKEETYTVGTNYDGGSNSNVVTLWKAGQNTHVVATLDSKVAQSTLSDTANGLNYQTQLTTQDAIDGFLEANVFKVASFKTPEANNTEFASNDGMLLSIPWTTTTYGAQMAFDDAASTTIKVRTKTTNWNPWKTLLHNDNYKSIIGSKSLYLKGGDFNYGLASYKNQTGSVTGTIVITLPQGWTNSMSTFEIDLYEYSEASTISDNTTNSKIIISGYNYSSSSKWVNYGYTTLGPFNRKVRLAYNGTKCCILIGETTSSWYYPHVYLSKILRGYKDTSYWNDNVEISVTTDESAYSKIVELTRTRQRFHDVVATTFRGNVIGNVTGNVIGGSDYIKVIECRSDNDNSDLWNTIKVNSNSMRMYIYDVYNDGGPNTYGNLLEIVGKYGHWQPQLWFESGKLGTIKHRNKGYNDNTWGEWYTLLDSRNYTDYTVKKDGTGASGTWGINVSGTASKWTSARTLTIGNKGQSVDGSANVTWNLHDILYNTSSIGTSTSWDKYTPGVYYVSSASAFTGTNNPESTNGGSSPYRYGQLIVSRADTGGVAQFYISHNDSNTSDSYKYVGIKFRTGWNNSYLNTWRTLLDTHNYSYFLDSRYYTETEADNRFVNVTGDTMTGTLAMSTGAAIHLWDDSASTSHRLTLRNSGDIGRIYNYTGSAYGAMYIGCDSSNAIVITSDQKVGIGVNSPSAKLSVGGEVKITTNYGTLTLGSQNESYTHYSTTGGNHYFNKAICVNGSVCIYNTQYKLTSDGYLHSKGIYANVDGSGSLGGVSLYMDSDPMVYGIAFRRTSTYGTHGSVTGSWATYLTMSEDNNRGWIFRSGSTNVMSIAAITGNTYTEGNISASNYISRVATGTQPYACTSTTLNTNLNADLLDGYQGSDYWRNSAEKVWTPSSNIKMAPTANYQEWSFDFRDKGSYTGVYWQVWDESKNTLLRVDADTGKVSAPYGFVGAIGDDTFTIKPEKNNEVNFGGTHPSHTIYFGYRATDSKPIPSNFVFGNTTGTAAITASQLTYSGTIQVNGNTGIYFRYNNSDSTSIVLSDVSFKPFDAANGIFNLGTSSGRWKGLYTQTGDISGTLSANTGTKVPFTTTTNLYYVRKALDWNTNSYTQNVILLIPVLQSNNWSGMNYIDGKFLLWKIGGNMYDVVEVNINCVYNTLEYTLTCSGQHAYQFKLCVCTYNGISYYALDCPYHANPYNRAEFYGSVNSILTGGTNTVALPLAVAYYDENSKTVLNSEVNSSKTSTLTTTYVTSAYARPVVSYAGFGKYDTTNSYALLGGGGTRAIGNASDNIALSNGSLCTNLNADKIDGYNVSVTSSPGTDSSTIYFVL